MIGDRYRGSAFIDGFVNLVYSVSCILSEFDLLAMHCMELELELAWISSDFVATATRQSAPTADA